MAQLVGRVSPLHLSPRDVQQRLRLNGSGSLGVPHGFRPAQLVGHLRHIEAHKRIVLPDRVADVDLDL